MKASSHYPRSCDNAEIKINVMPTPTKILLFDTRTRTGTERTDEVSTGNHDTVKELGSLVQQAQLRAGVKSNRGSGNCAESRTHSFTSTVEKFQRDKPSTILHSEGQTVCQNAEELPQKGPRGRTDNQKAIARSISSVRWEQPFFPYCRRYMRPNRPNNCPAEKLSLPKISEA